MWLRGSILARVWYANGVAKRVFCWKAKEVSREMGKREHLDICGDRNTYTVEKIAKRTIYTCRMIMKSQSFYWNVT